MIERNQSLEPDKRVCRRCIKDRGLSAFVRETGAAGRCDYCRLKRRAVVTLGSLCEFIVDQVTSEFGDADNEFVPYDGGEGGYQFETHDTQELLFDILLLEVLDNALAKDIVNGLPDCAWSRKWTVDRDLKSELLSGWWEYSAIVKEGIPPDELGPVSGSDAEAFGISYQSGDGIPAEKMLDALSAVLDRALPTRVIKRDKPIFRSRVTEESEPLPTTAAELGPPQAEKTRANRMTREGAVAFYGAFDRETTIAETFQPERTGAENQVVTVGTWKPLRELQVVDLARLPHPPSFFTDRELYHGVRFLQDFADDLAKPIERDGREHIEYIPTQKVTEHIRRVHRCANGSAPDGICYRSSKKNGRDAVVLFIGRAECGAEDAGAGKREPVLELDPGGVFHIEGRSLAASLRPEDVHGDEAVIASN